MTRRGEMCRRQGGTNRSNRKIDQFPQLGTGSDRLVPHTGRRGVGEKTSRVLKQA